MERRKRGHSIEKIIKENVYGPHQQGTRRFAQAMGWYDDNEFTEDDKPIFGCSKGQEDRVKDLLK